SKRVTGCRGEPGRRVVAEEALAIGVYSALAAENDFEKGILLSVNHGGDSDSTGAVAGSILGALLGMEATPARFKENLELIDVIREMAADLFERAN
ncbi:MAG: ADP-ribosylglycohydrolase family protein, partial [Desulfobacterales bacterium]|nr:ADP-ribosylglycohydrolase family protein [Desulfobacterales bacterium]